MTPGSRVVARDSIKDTPKAPSRLLSSGRGRRNHKSATLNVFLRLETHVDDLNDDMLALRLKVLLGDCATVPDGGIDINLSRLVTPDNIAGGNVEHAKVGV
ncbi:hypothetical protein CH063_15126, partial [Colletotrichum higginsianum]